MVWFNYELIQLGDWKQSPEVYKNYREMEEIMPVYKDETTNTWYCKFYYSTIDGSRKQTTKRGFPTKREAKQWESEQKAAKASNMSVTYRIWEASLHQWQCLS